MTTDDRHDHDLDVGWLDELSTDECWKLLSSRPVGRIGVNVDHYPIVLPVNFALDGETVVFRSGTGDKLNRIHGSKVSFEVDDIDPIHHTGWSVLVKGMAHGLNVGADHDLAEHSQASGAKPWAPGEHNYLVRIVVDEITGRRIHPAEFAPSSDIRAYL
jgi:uncharacterized protein